MERFAFVAELLVSLKDEDPTVVKRSIVSGTHLFCSALEEIALQFRQSGEAEKYFQELWLGISKFKDSVFCIFLKDGSVGTRLVAVKFIETFILLFLPETNGSDSQSTTQTREGKSQRFNISWLLGLYPVRNLDMFIQEADKQLHLLLDQLESPNLLPTIARKRPLYYNRILSALISFSPNFESDGSHVSSIQYSLRTAFLSFLKCTNSRDRLLGILRGMNAGEAADQVIRHIEKMTKNAERVGDSRYTKEEQLSSSGDFSRKRPIIHDNGRTLVPEETSPKQARIDPVHSSSGLAPDVGSTEGHAKSSSLGGDMTPVEQMIALIGALLAEGDRGAKSLEILISNFHPDLLADIVMANMKYLPKSPPLSGKPAVSSTTSQTSSSSVLHQVPPSSSAMLAQSSGFPSQTTALSTPNGTTLPILDVLPAASNLTDMKRDPRRDPRRLDPRRAVMPAGSQSTVVMMEESGGVQNGPKSFDLSATSRPYLHPVTTKSEDAIVSLACKAGAVASEESVLPAAIPGTNAISESLQESCDAENAAAIHTPEDKDTTSEPLDLEEQSSISVEAATSETIDAGSALESDQYSSAVSSSTTSEDTNSNLVVPPFLELSNEDQESIVKSAVTRIIEAYDQIRAAGGSHVRLALLARLVAEIDANNSIVMMLQRHGHDLSMHILYHLHAAMVSQSGGCFFSYYETIYEQFLVSVVKDLRDNFPASDKSLSRLLGEAPALPNSALQLLEELCHPEPVEHNGHETYNVEVERVTQGLGALWSLILGRPLVRQSCLDIVLKSAVHAQDDVRAKAIRLVANKLYHLNYLSEKIEQFATNMLLSVVDGELSPNTDVDQRMRANV
ncbi:Symplekin [Nymphaea thermarum]|nr:Symplekin [Nymphaea thermarum]